MARLLVLCFSFTLSAVAQLDSAALHAKFGMPLNRETFHMSAGFDLVVDYGANSQVCKLQVPALMPSTERVANGTVMKQRMYHFLSELVPDSIRGKELTRGTIFLVLTPGYLLNTKTSCSWNRISARSITTTP